jgi:phospholipase A1
LPVRWSTNPNERPKSGNLDPDYIAPAGVDYNNIEAKFQLSFKTKVLQGVFGVMVIYGGLYSKVPLANL